MEEERSVDELIAELRVLKIREAEIVTALERANRTGKGARILGAAEGRRQEGHAQVPYGFRRGDRVRIINKVRKPATAGISWTEEKERLATVTKIVPDQVHIRTDNGTNTWRAPNNLEIQTAP
jgi:hypothetical protein